MRSASFLCEDEASFFAAYELKKQAGTMKHRMTRRGFLAGAAALPALFPSQGLAASRNHGRHHS
jgi:hypothetical protein